MAIARVNGPYPHHGGFRVQVDTGSGTSRKRRYYQFATTDDAEKFIYGARDQAQGSTIADAIKAFIDAKRTKGIEESSVDSAEDRLAMLLGRVMTRPIRYLAGRGKELYTAAQVYPDGHRWAGRPRAAATHRSALMVVRDFGEFCVKRRWLKSSPFADVEPVGRKIVGADKSRHTVDESRQLFAWCLEHGRRDPGAALTLGYLVLGARASELVGRTVRDLDDGGRLLWIRRTKTVSGTRQLAIPDVLGGLLVAVAGGRDSDAPLFVRAEGKHAGQPWSRFMARDAVRRCCAAAKVPVLPPQALRRTQATLATDAGETGLAVARHLGHATGAAPAVTHQAYVGRGAAKDAAVERSLRVINGGRSG